MCVCVYVCACVCVWCVFVCVSVCVSVCVCVQVFKTLPVTNELQNLNEKFPQTLSLHFGTQMDLIANYVCISKEERVLSTTNRERATFQISPGLKVSHWIQNTHE